MPINKEKINKKASIVIEKKIDIQLDKVFIKELRLKLKLTQSAFAEVLGVTKKSVEKWEQGINNINGSAKKIALLLFEHPNIITLFSPYIKTEDNCEEKQAAFRYISYSRSFSPKQKDFDFIHQASIFEISMHITETKDIKENTCGTKN